jgi:hypothetical protein
MAFLLGWSLRCLLGGHEALLRQKRDDAGRAVKPHILIWECARCHRELGETALGAKWNLLAKIRRQRTPAQISADGRKRGGATTTVATRSPAAASSAGRNLSAAVPGHARR